MWKSVGAAAPPEGGADGGKPSTWDMASSTSRDEGVLPVPSLIVTWSEEPRGAFGPAKTPKLETAGPKSSKEVTASQLSGVNCMGGCQNYGPVLGPYYNTAPII